MRGILTRQLTTNVPPTVVIFYYTDKCLDTESPRIQRKDIPVSATRPLLFTIALEYVLTNRTSGKTSCLNESSWISRGMLRERGQGVGRVRRVVRRC